MLKKLFMCFVALLAIAAAATGPARAQNPVVSFTADPPSTGGVKVSFNESGEPAYRQLTIFGEGGNIANVTYDDYSEGDTNTDIYIIPASNLTQVNGGAINSLTYYCDGSEKFSTTFNVRVYVKEVNYTDPTYTYVSHDTCTVVYNGKLYFSPNGGDGLKMTVIFTRPFAYHGGNLLVAFENSTDSEQANSSPNFIAEDAASGKYAHFTNGNFVGNEFALPKVTIAYTTTLPEGVIALGNDTYSVPPSTTLTFTAEPIAGYYFSRWQDNSQDAIKTIEVGNSNIDLQAHFSLNPVVTLSANPAQGGSLILDHQEASGSQDGQDGILLYNGATLDGANTSRNIAVGPDGTIHVVYLGTNVNDVNLMYKSSVDGITYSEPVVIAAHGKEGEITVSNDGTIYISYAVFSSQTKADLYIAHGDGSTFTSVQVADDIFTYEDQGLHIAADGPYVYAITANGQQFFYSSDHGATYSSHTA